ncbi:MAG: FkbM family methyltransferase [Thermoleophilia bacterium]|nr:FkbM family methyltransferase [Thermoleophilia bacterium]
MLKSSRLQGPSAAKIVVARLGPVYRWARRLRALSRYLARRPHDPDFAAFGRIAGDGLFLDVGASIGQSALSFRIFNRASPILSLEPLPGHRGDLEFVGRVIRGHSFMMVGAAEESCRATLYVPMLGSYELPAESSLRREDSVAVLDRLEREGVDPGRLGLAEVEVELRRLDELELEPSFVKIDVEGAELEVLHGLRETIERSRPALMLERSERFDQVLELLVDGAGYRAYVYDAAAAELRPYTADDSFNVFFLRKEHGPVG